MAINQSIEHLDPNMIVEPKIKEPDVCFYDVRKEPFDVYGFYNYDTLKAVFFVPPLPRIKQCLSFTSIEEEINNFFNP